MTNGPKNRVKDSGQISSDPREMWLRGVADAMKRWFDDLQFPLPEFEVRTGFPGAGMRSSRITESWSQDHDKSYVIFVRPDRSDAIEVAAALAFQLCRIAVGHRDEHGHLFRHLAISIGLRGTQAESPPGALFTELATPILKAAGELPSPEIALAEKPKSTAQTTRLLRVSCPDCGYVARVSRKWIDEVGPPHCPAHGAMTVG